MSLFRTALHPVDTYVKRVITIGPTMLDYEATSGRLVALTITDAGGFKAGDAIVHRSAQAFEDGDRALYIVDTEGRSVRARVDLHKIMCRANLLLGRGVSLTKV